MEFIISFYISFFFNSKFYNSQQFLIVDTNHTEIFYFNLSCHLSFLLDLLLLLTFPSGNFGKKYFLSKLEKVLAFLSSELSKALDYLERENPARVFFPLCSTHSKYSIWGDCKGDFQWCLQSLTIKVDGVELLLEFFSSFQS